MLEDISIGGAGLRVANPISVGSWLEIQWLSRSFSGTVRHCRSVGMEYIIGVQKDNAVPSP
jgi:PilZ domain-containing protein